MPTADTYWTAATDFATLAESLAADREPLEQSLTGDDVVVGGRLRASLDAAIAAVVDGVVTTADGFRTLAEECRRRARACEAYTAALADHRAADAAWSAASPDERLTMRRTPPPHREPWMLTG